jgi:hypothetical protein
MWTGLLLCLVAIQLTLLWRRFYYGNDDLLQFHVADRSGLSWELLSLNVFHHFAPYNRLGHLLVARTGMSPMLGLAFMTWNLVALLLCALWFMTELGLSQARRVTALVLIGLSVTVSESGIWFDSSMHILAALGVTLAICAAHVRGVRSGARRWHVAALVLFVLGQLIQERPVFALPLAVLADLLLLWRTVPWRERLRRLWAVRWPVASLGVAAVAIALLLERFVVDGDGTTPSWETTGRTVLLALTDYVLPSVVNLPGRGASSWAGQLAVLAVVIIVGFLVARLRRGNAGPLMFASGAFLLYYGFLKLSPLLLDSPDSIRGNAERLHYAVYVVVPLVIAVMHLQFPGLDGVRRVRWAAQIRLGLVACLAAYLAFAANAYLSRQWAETTAARAYLDAVRADAGEWSSPDLSLVPLWAPQAMATSWATAYARHDRLLPLVVRGFDPGDLGADPVILDDTGRVRPARLVDVPGRVTVDARGCMVPGVRGGQTLVRAEVARTRDPAFLVVRYRAREATEVQVVTDAGRERQEGYFRALLPAGQRTHILPVDDPDIRAVALGPVDPASICVESLQVVRVLAVDDAGRCRAVDRYGHLGGFARCP